MKGSVNIFLLALIFWGGDLLAASLDCDEGATVVKNMICKSSNILVLDKELSRIYASYLLKYKKERADTVAEQNIWIKTVRDQCTDEDCLADVYRSRIDNLYDRKKTKKSQHHFKVLNGGFVCGILDDWYRFFRAGYWQSGLNFTSNTDGGYNKKIRFGDNFYYVRVDDLGVGGVVNSERGYINGTELSFYRTEFDRLNDDPLLSVFDESDFQENLIGLHVIDKEKIDKSYSMYHYKYFYYIEFDGLHYVMWVGGGEKSKNKVVDDMILLFSINEVKGDLLANFECSAKR